MFKKGDKIRCVDNSDLGAWGRLTFGKVYEVVELFDSDPVVVDDEGERKWFIRKRFVSHAPAIPDYLSACEALPFPEPVKSDDGAVYDYDGNRCEVKLESMQTAGEGEPENWTVYGGTGLSIPGIPEYLGTADVDDAPRIIAAHNAALDWWRGHHKRVCGELQARARELEGRIKNEQV